MKIIDKNNSNEIKLDVGDIIKTNAEYVKSHYLVIEIENQYALLHLEYCTVTSLLYESLQKLQEHILCESDIIIKSNDYNLSI